ncbi:hypothetical protein BKA70DRAFT_1430360 [Coprinopsis sp. MPI-PUGE-AT-0042]|nr:hypothetical protein BKA70DRAFT_1430360 [Coprinopsis sp. MPI-PUGE-AT-0042]
MHRTGCAIVGSVACRVFTLHSDWYNAGYNHETGESFYDWSYDLNIIAPAGRTEDCRAFFKEIGYTMWYTETVVSHYDNVVNNMQRGFMKEQDKKSIEVTITESSSGVLPVVLASPSTCQLNIISSTTLYSFFPSLSTTNITLRTDITRLQYPRQPHISVRLYGNNRM